MKNVCVFGASREGLKPIYYDTAYKLGEGLALAGYGVVFGGGAKGVMGALARGVHSKGGRLIGVIPEKLHQAGVAFDGCTELIVTSSMHERKQRMEDLSCAFIALAGGFGTLEELCEVLTLKQLGYHSHPIIIVNDEDFYSPTLSQFDAFYDGGFSSREFENLYFVTDSHERAVKLCSFVPDDEQAERIARAIEARTHHA